MVLRGVSLRQERVGGAAELTRKRKGMTDDSITYWSEISGERKVAMVLARRIRSALDAKEGMGGWSRRGEREERGEKGVGFTGEIG
jgi:hypothetical protein